MNFYTLLFGGWAGWLLLKSVNPGTDKSTSTTSTPVTSTPTTSRPITHTPATHTPVTSTSSASTLSPFHPSTQVHIPGAPATSTPVSLHPKSTQITIPGVSPTKYRRPPNPAGGPVSPNLEYLLSESSEVDDIQVLQVALPPQKPKALIPGAGAENQRKYRIVVSQLTALFTDPTRTPKDLEIIAIHLKLAENALNPQAVLTLPSTLGGTNTVREMALAGKSSRRHAQNLGGLKSWSRHDLRKQSEARRNAELREITMAKKQAGARVDLHQEIKPTRDSQILTTDTLRKSGFVPADSVNSNIGSALLKTRDAMGRLLG